MGCYQLQWDTAYCMYVFLNVCVYVYYMLVWMFVCIYTYIYIHIYIYIYINYICVHVCVWVCVCVCLYVCTCVCNVNSNVSPTYFTVCDKFIVEKFMTLTFRTCQGTYDSMYETFYLTAVAMFARSVNLVKLQMTLNYLFRMDQGQMQICQSKEQHATSCVGNSNVYPICRRLTGNHVRIFQSTPFKFLYIENKGNWRFGWKLDAKFILSKCIRSQKVAFLYVQPFVHGALRDGWTYGRMDKRTNGRTDGRMDIQTAFEDNTVKSCGMV